MGRGGSAFHNHAAARSGYPLALSGGQLTSEHVTDWADLVECRVDLGYERGFEDALQRALFELANPNLTEPVTPKVAEALQNRLS